MMLTTRLGLPRVRGMGSFIAAMFVDALGSGLFVPFSLLYFHIAVGLPLSAVGLTLTIATILSLPMTLVTGMLVDRLGALRIVIASQLLLVVGFLGYLLVRSIPELLITALLATAGDRMFWVAQPTMIAEIANPGEQDRWYGLVGTVRMAGLSIGGFLAGLVISLGSIASYRALAGADALSFLIVVGLLLPHLRELGHRDAEQRGTSGYRIVLKDRPFLGLVVSNVAFIFCIVMLTTALPVYIIEALRTPVWVVGIVLAFNTTLMTGGQTLTVRLLEPYRRTRVLMLAGLIWSGSCGLLALALVVPRLLLVPYLFVVVGVYTCAQLMHAPTANAFAAEAGPIDLRGRYVAAYQLSWGIGFALIPALFTLLFTLGPALPWVVLTGLTLVAALVIHQLERMLPTRAVRMAIRRSLPSTMTVSGEP